VVAGTVLVAFIACSSSVSSGDRNICTSWVAAATAINRGTALGQSASPAEQDVINLLGDASYQPQLQAVAAMAVSAHDPALRDAATTLQSSLHAAETHGTVDSNRLLAAMSTLTSRCNDLGFPILPASSH
jgi:hypothetical protein